MGYVTSVVEALKKAGVRAEAAFPGRLVMEIFEPVAAVELESVDYGTDTEVILVTVMAPRSVGGAACAVVAEKAARSVADMASHCRIEKCQYNAHADMYYIPVRLTFAPEPEGEPVAPTDLIVKVGDQLFHGVIRVQGTRQEDPDEGITLENAPWTVEVEEVYKPGEAETQIPQGTVTLTVSRERGTETFSQCRWTSIRRETGVDLLRQIRTGIAGSRTYTAQ